MKAKFQFLLYGVCSIFNLFGNYPTYQYNHESDQDAISDDWKNVGQHINSAYNGFKQAKA